MFQFGLYPSQHYEFMLGCPDKSGPVIIFGNLRIKAFWQLPEAYRSLIRPSSVLSTKASTVCIIVEYFLALNPDLCREIWPACIAYAKHCGHGLHTFLLGLFTLINYPYSHFKVQTCS